MGFATKPIPAGSDRFCCAPLVQRHRGIRPDLNDEIWSWLLLQSPSQGTLA
jgi:hypothetical protein